METRDDILAEVRRIARWNGGSICVLSLAAALLASGWGAAFGLLVAAAGYTEVHGGNLAPRDAGRALSTLIASQIALIALIGGYAAWRLATFDLAALAAQADAAGLSVFTVMLEDEAGRELLTTAFQITYITLLVLTLCYQGGMAWLYRSRIRRALAQENVPGSNSGD
jgi:hypothetical protein